MQTPFFVGIAGGSGSGKSTLAFALQSRLPELVSIVHLDDYFNPLTAPKLNGMTNWDHPDALDFEKLYQDLVTLKAGQDILVLTKNERDNPGYPKQGKIPVMVKALPIILVEGYLLFHFQKIRDILDLKIFLEAPLEVRWRRRKKFKGRAYLEKVFLPMEQKFLAPTQEYADHVLNVQGLSIPEMVEQVQKLLPVPDKKFIDTPA